MFLVLFSRTFSRTWQVPQEIEKIVDRRVINRRRYVKVKWLWFGSNYNSWVPESDLIVKERLAK